MGPRNNYGLVFLQQSFVGANSRKVKNMISFYEQQKLNKLKMQLLKYKSSATKFVADGGLLSKGQNIFYNRPVLFDNRNYKIVEVDKTRARLGRLRHRVWSWAECIKHVSDNYNLFMVTLTYREIADWGPNNIRQFMLLLRSRFPHIIAYAWVAELQKRGAVHYHVMVAVPVGFPFYGAMVGHPDKLGDWPHGMTRIDKARTPWYIVTYSGKEYQKLGKFPKGMRMFAVWIAKGVVTERRMYKFSLSAKPKWITDIVISNDDLFDEMPRLSPTDGGGWDVGRFLSLPSPYTFLRYL